MYNALVWVFIGATLIFLGVEYLDTPTVYRNVSTRECIAVEDKYGFRACNQQPDTHEVIFVQFNNFEQMQRSRAK